MDPEEAQERVLERLLEGYSRTQYGRERGATEVSTIEDYRERFPIVKYGDLEPYIERVLEGDWRALLPEPPEWFGVTSGTRGVPKVVPLTRSDVGDRLHVMRRGLEAIGKAHGVFPRGTCLCLYFPSRIAEVSVGGRRVPCGYISGVYAALFERAGFPVRPPVAEMDAIGDGTGPGDWARRFELTYKYLREEDVGFAIGAPRALLLFGEYLVKRHGVRPADLWDVSFMLCAGEPHIPDYARDLKRLYGRDVVVVEGYGATEGMFAMQLGEEPYLTSFYDTYFFEVRVRGKVKMLYEMREGEVGSLIVSTRVLPRYEIGDLVKCYKHGEYYRVLGRDTPTMRLLVTVQRAFELFLSVF